MTRRSIAAIAALAALGAVAAAPATAKSRFDVTVKTQKLERLSGARYEVWVVKGAHKFSGGTFNIRPNGTQTRTTFASPVAPRTADAIAVTVEPVPDPSPAPSRAVILVGKPSGKSAALAFPVDLSTVSGSFVLASPTDAVTTNETSGLWFLNPSAGPGPGLNLPALPKGWTYEGWGVSQGTPLSSGKFTAATGADRSAVFSGPNPGPPFPGEDFVAGLPSAIAPPFNLADGNSKAVVSIEPDLGAGVDPSGPGPFSIKPLVAMIGAGQADHASVALMQNLGTVPTGSAALGTRRHMR